MAHGTKAENKHAADHCAARVGVRRNTRSPAAARGEGTKQDAAASGGVPRRGVGRRGERHRAAGHGAAGFLDVGRIYLTNKLLKSHAAALGGQANQVRQG